MATMSKATPKKDSSVTYFPVNNGDTSLIQLSDGTTIVIDLNFTAASCDEDDLSCYDIRAHLLREMRRDERGRPHVDAFIITHPDQDHLRGLDDVFYLGDPEFYSKTDKQADLIIVDELWFAPRVFCEFKEDLNEDAKLLRKEADRRKELYCDGKASAASAGNRLRMLGQTENDDLEGLEDITTTPGTTVSEVNGCVRTDIEFFLHAPFKRHTDAEDCERNDTSVVLQARFTVAGEERAALAFFGGDAGCEVWQDIARISEDESLEWDLFLAPHHCSWSFFSTGQSDDAEANDAILDLLDKRRQGAMVIASSKPIKDDDDNPPHYIAAQHYKEKVGSDRFFCTGSHPTESKPEPLYFTMTANGPVKDTLPSKGAVLSSSSTAAAVATPRTYG
jgi:hypothetical protein